MNYQNSVLFASAFCFGFANISSNSSNNCFFSGWSKKNTFPLHKIAEKVMSDLKVKGNYVKPQSEKTPAGSKQIGMRISQKLLNCASTIHFIDLWSYKNILHSRKVCLFKFRHIQLYMYAYSLQKTKNAISWSPQFGKQNKQAIIYKD